MCIDAATELNIRQTLLTARAAGIVSLQMPSVTAGKNVFNTPFKFESKQDFAARIDVTGAAAIKAMESKLCYIEYDTFEDTGAGSNDCTVVNLIYKVFILMEFRVVRADNTKPYNDFMAMVMEFVRRFTTNKQLAEGIRISSFRQAERVSSGEFSPYLPEVKASFTSFRCAVEVR